ncbi:MAG: citrate/2-methylcitrate synthase [Acidimicrobiales bacterium]
MDARISAAEAAGRLGIKRETLYAYVSRGMLPRERGSDRGSTFSADEVAAMAARTRRGGRASGLELIVATALTSLQDGELRYRGVDVRDLVPDTSFETVAEWLWTGVTLDPVSSWPAVPAPSVLAASPPLEGIDGLRVAVAMAGDPLRYDLSPPGVVTAGRRAIAAMVDGLAVKRPPSGDSIAARLTARLTNDDHDRVVNAALVLLADHELAASTLAARVAASVRADPYSVVATGLGVIAGALHGAASEPVVTLLEEIGRPGREAVVVGDRLRRGERIPGLGHKVYRHVDPRTEILLDLLRQSSLPPERWATVEELLALLRDRFDLVVNVDFALGAFVWAAGLDVRAAECLFAIARTAGWLAHALEEYGEEPLRFRPRAVYTGASSLHAPGRLRATGFAEMASSDKGDDVRRVEPRP